MTIESDVRTLLERRLAEVEALSAATDDDRKPVELDQTAVGRLSRMDLLQARAMAAETERRRVMERRRITAALKRLDDGEYGYCARCGESIQPGRLATDPAIAVCVACAGGAGQD